MGAKKFYKWLKKLAGRNYRLARATYMMDQRRTLDRAAKSPILIHQMGKVGSKSIRYTLRHREPDRTIYHTHHLAWDRVIETEIDRKEFFRTERDDYLKRPWLSRFIRSQIDDPSEKRRWKVVSLTRDPIGRNLSGFFENVAFKVLEPDVKYEIESHYYRIEPTVIDINELDKVVELFFDRYRHDTPLNYFDKEIKDVFGIDVYATEFPKDKGYAIYSGRNADLIVIRLESLNSCVKEAFKEFLDLDDFALENTNVGDEKNYAAAYKKFKETIQLPEEYLDKFYDSKFVRHFYTDAEIETFRAKWQRNKVS